MPSPSDAPRLASLHPRLRTIAVTGTNGKTTTTAMVAAIVAASGEISARVTTVGAWVGDELVHPSPDFEAFRATVERAIAAGVRTLALETTSRALEEGFARRWPPHVAVFTNLTRDHLDRHGTPERYLAAKAQLFLALGRDGCAVLNAADPVSALLDEVIPRAVRRTAYAARPVSDECGALDVALAAERVELSAAGTQIALAPGPLADRLGRALRLSVVGHVNADNALAAALATDALGYPADAIVNGLARFTGAPGRFEVVSRRPLVVVDYAHTPDALERTLSSARQLATQSGGRVLCVFGCGGDRDTGKRGAMGAIASTLADEAVLTTDNPRHEPPEAIARAVIDGWTGAARRTDEPDRARAIERAIDAARDGDVVVIAGKGHERTQQIGDELLPFSDVEVASEALARRGG